MCMKNQNVISFIVYRPRCEIDMGRFRLRSRNQTTIPTPILESESESFVVSLRWSRNRSQNGGDWNRIQNGGDWNRIQNGGDWNRNQNRGDWNRIQNRGDWNRNQNRGDWNRSQNRGDWNRSRNCGDCNRIRMTIPIPHMYVDQYLI